MPFRQPSSYADSMGKLWCFIKLEPISAKSSQYNLLFYSLLWLYIQQGKHPRFPLLAFYDENRPVTGGFSRQRPVHYGKFSMSWRHQEAMKIHTRKWLILRETSCNVRDDINKLSAIECIIKDNMSVSNTTGILFPDIKWLIHWSLFVLNSVMLCALPK